MKKLSVADTSLARTPPQSMAPAPTPEPTEEDMMRKGGYDLDSLMSAEDIKSDPKRMEYVHKAHGKKMTAMRSIQDLKVAGQALAMQKKDAKAADQEDAAEGGAPAQPRHKTRYPKR